MRQHIGWLAAGLLLVAVAGCGEPGAESPAPTGQASPDPAGETFAGWLEILDDELAGISDATTAWTDESEVHVVAMCGPADEVEGWQVTATLAPDVDAEAFAPPAASWTETDDGGEGQTVWRHREHEGLTLVALRSADGYVQARAVSPGVELADFVDVDDPGQHPRVHPQPLDPDTHEPRYCG